ncbi:hypothetical protein T484DRAFT_1813928 [Baffinella frigidus]|nr:hypothetical protein T484DRAFT_1813928 [Cryptophyta sp. CCMP2293]
MWEEQGQTKRPCPPASNSRPRDLANCLEALGGFRGDSGAITNLLESPSLAPLLNFSPSGSATGAPTQASATPSPGLQFLSGLQGSPVLAHSAFAGQAAMDNNAALYQSIQALLQRHGVDASLLTREYACRMMQSTANTTPHHGHAPISPMSFNQSPAGRTPHLGMAQVPTHTIQQRPTISSQALPPAPTLSTVHIANVLAQQISAAQQSPYNASPYNASPYNASMLSAARLADSGMAVMHRPFLSADIASLSAFKMGDAALAHIGAPLQPVSGGTAKKERRAESVSSSRSQKEGARSHGPSTDRYKNRWTDEEIQSLRLGMARFGKQTSSQRSEKSNRRDWTGESSKSCEAESVWEQILATYWIVLC